MMDHIEILLPLPLLILVFGLKLGIDRNVDLTTIIQALCELPVDMMFLAISFLMAFTISSPENPSEGLFLTIAFIAIAILVVILWRKCLKLFEGRKDKHLGFVLIVNFLLSLTCLYNSTQILIGDAKGQKQEEKKVIELKGDEDKKSNVRTKIILEDNGSK